MYEDYSQNQAPGNYSGNQGYAGQDYYQDQQYANNTPKKTSKLPIIIVAIIGLLALIALAVILVIRFMPSGSSSIGSATIWAIVDESHNAYLPLPDGDVVKIKGETTEAAITPDRKTIFVLDEDGTLYHTDKAQKSKTTIEEDIVELKVVKNDAAFFVDEKNTMYRYTLKDGELIELGRDLAITVAENTASVLYAFDNGDIYLLPATESEGEKVGYFENNITVNAVTDDGKIAVWTLKDGSEQKIVLFEDGEKETLGSFDNKYSSTTVTMSKDHKLIFVTNYGDNHIYIKKPGEDTVSAKFGDELAYSTVYCAKGTIRFLNASEIKSVYVMIEADEGKSLYNVTLDGEREKVLSKVDTVAFGSDRIVYTNTDKDLYVGKVKGADITDKVKVTGDVTAIRLAPTYDYVYYHKEADKDGATLYAYSIKADQSKKVASNVACYSSSIIDTVSPYFQVGANGSTVYYEKDMETVGDTYTHYGTLYKWDFKSGDSVKISSDVITSSLSSYQRNGGILPKFFIFRKYSSLENGDVIVDIFSYNGSKAQKIASDVVD